MTNFPKFSNEIENLNGSHLAVYEEKDERIIHMGNDWNNCQDFIFDNKEQIQQLIEELVKLKERWE